MPERIFHFISGLPRACSTLTATILPPDLFRRYAQLAFWRDLKDSKAFRIVRQSSAEKQSETMPDPEPAIAPEAAR